MQLSTLILGLAACIIPASCANITPPKYFVLQAEANSLTNNTSYDGYYIYEKQVSNTAAVAVPAPTLIPAIFYQLTSPNTTAQGGKTLYSLLIDSDNGRNGYMTPDLTYQAYWQSLYLTYAKSSKPTPQQTVFYVGGNKTNMYLEMTNQLTYTSTGSPISEGFNGFLICSWSQLIPQLFFRTFYGGDSVDLPDNCDYYNIRVIPLTK